MSTRYIFAALAGAAAATASANLAHGHEIVGNRLFPATLTIDDPGVADELALPTIAWSKSGDSPSFKQLDVSAEYAKRITEDFGISISPTWSRLYAPGGSKANGASGFQNIETALKYRLFKSPAHEFVMSIGLEIEWGGSGAAAVGAESFNVYSPTVYFGKGFGDLPDGAQWLKPFAITGQFGYAIPGVASVTDGPDTEFNARVLEWGGSLQYSLPYLKSAVADLGLPDFVNHLIPIVEASFETPVSNTFSSGTVTTGTISPGVIWVGKYTQVGLEAMIPVNRQSGRGIGAIGQLHFFLDDIAPTTIGRPLFVSSINAGRPNLGH